MKKSIHELIRRVSFGNKSKAEVLAKAMLRIITEKAVSQGVDPREIINALYFMHGRSAKQDDILIGISGMDAVDKTGRISRKVNHPKIRVFGRDGDDYIQLGLIQKLTLAVDTDNTETCFEAVLPECPQFSDRAKNGIRKSTEALKQAGASLSYRKF